MSSALRNETSTTQSGMPRCFERSGIFLTPVRESICSSCGGQCGNSIRKTARRRQRERKWRPDKQRAQNDITKQRLTADVRDMSCGKFRHEEAPLFTFSRLSAAKAAPWQQPASERCRSRRRLAPQKSFADAASIKEGAVHSHRSFKNFFISRSYIGPSAFRLVTTQHRNAMSKHSRHSLPIETSVEHFRP